MTEKTNQRVSQKRAAQLSRLLNRLQLDSNKSTFQLANNQRALCILDEALTHTSINYPVNHEKLEFLGDAVLRLAASEYIEENYPKLKVGDRSALRAQLVSDQWLGNIGGKIGIKDIMLIVNSTKKI